MDKSNFDGIVFDDEQPGAASQDQNFDGIVFDDEQPAPPPATPPSAPDAATSAKGPVAREIVQMSQEKPGPAAISATAGKEGRVEQVAPDLFVNGDTLFDSAKRTVKPGQFVTLSRKDGTSQLLSFEGSNDDGKPVFKDVEGITGAGADLAGEINISEDDYNGMFARGKAKMDRSPLEQVRLQALADTGDAFRYTDDAGGTFNALYDYLMPFLGGSAKKAHNERTRHLSNIREGRLDGYAGETEAEKIRDAARKAGLEPWNPLESLHPGESDEAFLKRIRKEADNDLRLGASAKQKAAAELGNTEATVGDKIVKGGITSGAFALQFAIPGSIMFKGLSTTALGAKAIGALTTLGSAIPATIAEADARYSENITPEYGWRQTSLDGEPEFGMIAAPDSESEAAYKAIGGAVFDTAVEVGLEAATMGLLRLAGKPAGWVLGKVTPGAVKEWGAKNFNKFVASETGQALRQINRAYQDFSGMTQINSPLGELAEENVQALEKMLGLEGKSSEYKGLAKEWQDFKDKQLNWQTQWDIFYGLIAQLAIGSANSTAHGIVQHMSSADARRDVRMALKRSGISDETISTLTPKQQKTLTDMWQRYSADPDTLKDRVKNLGYSMRAAVDELTARDGLKMRQSLEQRGIAPERFTIQTGEDGKPAFQQMMRFTPDGKQAPMNAMTDTAHGVTIVDQGDGTFYVMNDFRGIDAIPASSFEEAQKKADEEVVRNQSMDADNEQKAQYLMGLVQRQYAGRNVVSIPSESALRWQVAQAVRDGGDIYGITRADQLFKADGSLKQPGAGGFHTPDGHIVVILDNVPSPAEMERVLAHEATGHEGVESATGRGANTVEFIQNAQAERFSRYLAGERARAIRRFMEAGMDEATATAGVDAAMSTDDYAREAMARYAQGRLHQPTWYEKRRHEQNQRRRDAGESVPIDQSDLEVMLAEAEAKGAQGANDLETLPGDSGVRYEEGVPDEAGNGADEAQPQPADEDAGRGAGAGAAEAGEGSVEAPAPRAEAQDAGVVEPPKTANGGQNPTAETSPVPPDSSGGNAEQKPKGKRGDNLRGRSYEDYGAHPDDGGTGDQIGAMLLRYAKDNDGILAMPNKGDPDPLADWIDSFLDGNVRKNRRGAFIALFGMSPRRGGNDGITEGMPPELEVYLKRVIESRGIEAVPEMLLKAREDFAKWVGDRRRAQAEAKDSPQSADEGDVVSIAEIEARDAADAEYDNAYAEVERYEAGSPVIRNFSREQMRTLKRGDVLRFDHADTSWDVVGYDAENDVVTVVPQGALDNPLLTDDEIAANMVQYRVSADGAEEVKPEKGKSNGRKDERGTAEAVAGDAQGATGGGTEAQGGGFQLESVTAEQITAEQKKRAEKEAIKKRQEAPLKGSGAVNVQPEMDIGQTGQQDLFSPIAEKPAQEPPKNAPRSAPSAEGTTTPPKTENAPQGKGSGIERTAEDRLSDFQDGRVRVVNAESVVGKSDDGADIKTKTRYLTVEHKSQDGKRFRVVYDYASFDEGKKSLALQRMSDDGEWLGLNFFDEYNKLTPTQELDFAAKMIDQVLGDGTFDKMLAKRKQVLETKFANRDEAMEAVAEALSAYIRPKAEKPPQSADAPQGGKSPENATPAPKPEAPRPVSPVKTGEKPKKPAFKRGDKVFLKGAAENQRVTFLKANADGTADVQVKTPGANRYAPEKVETRTVPMGDISATGMKDTLTEAEKKRLEEGVKAEAALSIRMKDEAAEKLARQQEDDVAALFDTPKLADEQITGKLDNEKKFLDWTKKWKLDPSKKKNQREWANKNGVSFDTPEFDPDMFQKRVGAVAKLVKTYKDSGVADFKTLATRMAERFPDKFGAMKPYLRGVWNAVAEQMDLEEVSRKDAEATFAAIEKPQETASAPEAPKAPPANKLKETRISDAADEIVALIERGQKFTRKDVTDIVERQLGGKVANGDFDAKQVTDILELGVNKWIARQSYDGKGGLYFAPSGDAKAAVAKIQGLRDILALIPTQTTRSVEQDKMQQFSTPPTEAFAAAWVANMNDGDVMLEPSAGIGGLAVFGANTGAKVITNELSPRRAEILEQLGLGKPFEFNAENLYAFLEPDIKAGKLKRPTVVVMNPPFSNSQRTDKKNTHIGADHVEQALKLLAPGGRLVAIVGNGMAHGRPAFKAWWDRIGREYTVRANVGVNGQEYAKYGTTFDNNIIVIDKVTPNGSITPIYGKIESLDELPALLEGVRNDRPKIENRKLDTRADERVEQQTVRPGPLRPGRSVLRPGGNGAGSSQPNGRRASVGIRGNDEGQRERGESDGRGDRGPSGQPALDALPVADGLTVQSAEQTREVGDGTFSEYKPSKVSIPGMKPHQSALVESSAMASVQPPDPTYSPRLPKEIVENGVLSEAQLEQVVYAGQAHEQMLGNGERKGYFIGDGTGVGKGREISGIILDNFNNGRRKAVWISLNGDLADDAKRDLVPFGLDGEFVELNTKKKGLPSLPARSHGVAFTTYSSLAQYHAGINSNGQIVSEPKAGKNGSRFAQLVKWLGSDFDGVIAFDEAHAAANAVSKKGKRGSSKPSKRALAVLDLQRVLPKARILYVSATGATEVSNLAYAARLGLWGKGTAFKDRDSFINQVSAGGLSVMEIVARDMKAMGVYMARNLSFEGVENDRVTHELSPDQIKNYNLLADTWQMVMGEIENALISSGGIHGAANSGAKSAFWGAHQRFFGQVLSAAQMPSVLKKARELWEAGYSPVFQVVTTSEAQMKRAMEEARKLGQGGEMDIENLDLSPRGILIGFVQQSFPTVQYVEEETDGGKTRWMPLKDKNGNYVHDPAAVERKERLIGRLQRMKLGESPIDMILNEFGHENVAEITGRSRRRELARNEDGEMVTILAPRSDPKRKQELEDFKNGKRTVLIFSKAGATGASYHANRDFKNQRRRAHFLIEAGYNAADAIQGLGRTHRTNESSHPLYELCSTNLPGHKRFMSTIARRLAQLGSLTSGDRSSSGSGVFSEADNLENQYAKNAVLSIFEEMFTEDPAKFNRICTEMGFMKARINRETGEREYVNTLIDKEGQFDPGQELDIPHFLNRILAMKIDAQNELFDEFSKRMAEDIERAKETGTFDPGMEKLKGITVEVKNRTNLWTDAQGIGTTDIVEVGVAKRSRKTDYAKAKSQLEYYAAAGAVPRVYTHNGSGDVLMMVETKQTRTMKDGSVVTLFKRLKPNGETDHTTETAVDKNYTQVLRDEAGTWMAAYNAVPDLIEQSRFFAHGTLLPIWDRLNAQNPRFYKIVPTGGAESRAFLGMEIAPDNVENILARFGKSVGSVEVTPDVLLNRIMKDGRKVELQNGWTLKRVKVLGDSRIEIDGVDEDADVMRLAREPFAYSEKIGYLRVFVKPNAESLRDFLAEYPAVPDKGGLATASGTAQDLSGDKYKAPLRAYWSRIESATPAEATALGEQMRGFIVRLSSEQLGEIFDDYAALDNDSLSAAHVVRRMALDELVARGALDWRRRQQAESESPGGDIVNFDTPGIYTGTAADYANRSRQGGVDDGPSLKKIGMGEGSQVYGWGLYGSAVRGVAEKYAKQLKKKEQDIIKNNYWLRKNGAKVSDVTANVYEQTFFTNRAEGDESHLLKWYEPVTREQIGWIESRLKAEGIGNVNMPFLKGELPNPDNPSGGPANAKIKNGRTVYDHLANKLGSPQAASEFLARAGIDGIKYPVDSYGGKTIKDGDEAGWNYVSFRDDNIRVDHKWTDGVLQFDTPELTPAEAEYAASGDKTPTEKVMREVYGMTNDEIATALRASGMEPPAHVKKSDEVKWQQAEVILSNPTYMAKLSRAAAKFPRPLRDFEIDALDVLFRERQNAVNAAQSEVDDWKQTLDSIADGEVGAAEKKEDARKNLAAAQSGLARAKALMLETGKAKIGGASEQGRGLRANRGSLYQDDLTYAGITGEIAQIVGGADRITPEMDAQIRDLAKLFEDLDAQGLRIATERLKPLAEKVIKQTKDGLKVRKATERKAGDEAKRVTRNYQDALNQIEVGAVEVGGTLIGISDQQYPSWGKWLKAIGEFHCFENPNITEEECINAILEDISPFMVDEQGNVLVDANQVRDALTGFGHNYRQSRYDSQRLMNDLKSQARLKRQLDWMDETNTLPPATGMVRDEPSDTTRNLQKQVAERKKEVPDAGRDERRLKGVLDTIKKRLENRIEELKRAIETGERIPAAKRKVIDDLRVRELRAEKDEWQKKYDDLFGTTRTLTPEQKIAMAEKILGRMLEADLVDLDRARQGDFSKIEGRPAVTEQYIRRLERQMEKGYKTDSPTLQALREKRLETLKAIFELKKAKYAFGMTPEEIEALNARKITNREKAVARLAERVVTGDIRTGKPQPPMTKDQQKRYDELGEQMKRGRQKLAELRLEAENATVPTFVRKGVNFLRFVTTAQRALRATMDFSAVLRQAARMTLGHPVKAAVSFGKAWTAMRSETSLLDVNTEIMSDPTVQEAVKKFGLHLREVDAQSDRDVEMFHGMERNHIKLFGKEFAITDIPFFGEFMLKSERHYLTYLNAMSADLYTSIVNGIPGGATPWQKKMIADMINIWNGSAALSKERRQALQKAWVNDIFWAPQLAISRVQSAVGYDIWHPLVAKGIKNADGTFEKVSNDERKTAAKVGLSEHLRSTVAMLAIGALLKWLFSDDDDKYNFSQADWFEKMMMLVSPKIGNTTIDLTGGESTFDRLVHQLATKSKRTGTGRLQKFGDFHGPSTWGAIGRYLQGKLSPSVSTVTALWEGKDYVGDEYGIGKMTQEMLIPLTFEDVKDQIVQDGIGKSLITVPLTLLGAGGSTYDRKPYENAVNTFLEAEKEYGDYATDGNLVEADRKAVLDEMKASNPLLADGVRDRLIVRRKGGNAGLIPNAQRAERQLKRLQADPNASKSDIAEAELRYNKTREDVMKLIRENRRGKPSGAPPAP